MMSNRSSFPWLALYLGVIQFLLLIGWTVYAAYLPELLEGVGIARHWTAWVLIADQVLFACFDVIAGFLAARAFRFYARIGPVVIAVTALSCAAFMALPFVRGFGAGPWLFLSLLAVWAIGSAALRAPVFALLARHAGASAMPGSAALALFGMGLASALSPYLGLVLKSLDPRLPFSLASLALMLTATGLILVERRADHTQGPAPAPDRTHSLPSSIWLLALFLAAFAVQIIVFLYAAPRYALDLGADRLPWLLPLFWVAFSLVAFPVRPLVKRLGPVRLFGLGVLLGLMGTSITLLPGPHPAMMGFALAGIGWGMALPSAFGFAAASGLPHRAAVYTGYLFAMLALAAFLRIGIKVSGWTAEALSPPTFGWLPMLAWLLAALAVGGFLVIRGKGRFG